MALGSLNLRVSKSDFEMRINTIEVKMQVLQDVINRYGDAKRNLDQFIEGDDSNYQAMLDRIDANVLAAKKAYSALQETKLSLQQTVDQMEGFGNEVKETISAATEATVSTIEAAIKIDSIL
ncbi:MAG: hypothetical protein IJP27_10180 [Clostridia bacterium]|nr:hypothetical protein [Clostridia bacterium]